MWVCCGAINHHKIGACYNKRSAWSIPRILTVVQSDEQRSSNAAATSPHHSNKTPHVPMPPRPQNCPTASARSAISQILSSTLFLLPSSASLVSGSYPIAWTWNHSDTKFFPALDTILFLSTVMVLKGRAERERYRHIDEKNAFNGI